MTPFLSQILIIKHPCNICCKQKEKHRDVLYSIMLQCKLAEGSSDAFVWDVKAAPSLQSVLFFYLTISKISNK